MDAGEPNVAVDDAVSKVTRLDWTGTALLIVAVAAACALLGSGWRWPYFLWGLGTGVLVVVLTRLALRLGYRWSSATADEIARARVRSFARWRSVYATTVITGVAIGALAARIGSPVPDIAFTLLVVVAQVVALLAARRLRRVSE